MRLTVSLAVGAALLLAPTVQAQDGPISRGYLVQVALRDVPALEAAIKAHQDWHRAQGDTWTWFVASSTTGRLGEYVNITGGHNWADFDNPPVDPAADLGNWLQTGGLIDQVTSSWLGRDLPELGRPSTAEPTIVQVIEFELLPGGEQGVLEAAAKIKEAADAANFEGGWSWSRSVSQDGPPTLTFVIPGANWAAFDVDDEEFFGMMVQKFGQEETMRIFKLFYEGAREISSRMWAARLDLSYFPE